MNSAIYSYFVVSLLGLGGFLLAFNIFRKKRSSKKLVCPIGHDCDPVIYSPYSKFFGIPLEYLGMAYYFLVTAGYFAYALGLSILPKFSLWLVVLTAFGFLFSIYLTFIQAVVLKKWCTWCLISASICTTVFLIEIGIMKFALFPALVAVEPFTVGLHILAVAVGVGVVTISEIFFLKFLKDYRISHEENEVLHILSQILWTAIAILIATEVAIAIVSASHAIKDLFQSIVLGVILLNTAFLNLVLTPRLATVTSGSEHLHIPGELTHLRRLAFFMSAVSIASWYTLFFANILTEGKFLALAQLLTFYIAVFIIVAIINHVLELISGKHPELNG